ncbi:pSer/pThr/pTyr-binding forkhead associated (FHA) protein [Variovorax sp. GrIS 2.14]|uniref:FHA domain-containing protein n=1 Tax=Variovorax sp. GrIS 2.14 TaxID=3071709 RepID=UPI0038F7DFCA
MKRSLLRLDEGLSRLIVFSGAHALLGRDGVCDVVVADTSVSRQHACIEMPDDAPAAIRDLHSLNGVFVNERLVDERQALQHLDVLKIGKTRFRFFEVESYRDSDLMISSS